MQKEIFQVKAPGLANTLSEPIAGAGAIGPRIFSAGPWTISKTTAAC